MSNRQSEIDKVTESIKREQQALARISLDFPAQRERQAKKIAALMKWQARLWQVDND